MKTEAIIWVFLLFIILAVEAQILIIDRQIKRLKEFFPEEGVIEEAPLDIIQIRSIS